LYAVSNVIDLLDAEAPAQMEPGRPAHLQVLDAVGGGVLPDLRYSGTLDNDQWFDVVLKGQLKQAGMVSFDKDLSHDDAAAIRAYVIFRANQSLLQSTPAPK